ncbi:exported hypothetical protein [Frankia sp. AiPs1]|uniref:hypothetical protein n=1 Tax=Frankia sp. AiPa1 TaxID=573492 RepID=UPI00202B4C8E|nr:hypothetical protein [Frankia sp. AiPa1]MCL9758828.1 hypothetical protein [Frankia sp. AiPa1]
MKSRPMGRAAVLLAGASMAVVVGAASATAAVDLPRPADGPVHGPVCGRDGCVSCVHGPGIHPTYCVVRDPPPRGPWDRGGHAGWPHRWSR